MAEAEGASPLSSLSDVFSNDPAPAAKAASEPASSEKTEGKDEGDQKFPVGASSSDKSDEKSDDEKSDEKDEKSEKPSPDAKSDAEKASDAKSDSEKEDKLPKGEDDKKKWESEENPYFKRFRDTSANWNKEHQEKIALQNQYSQMQQEIVRLRKIADGTYDPEKDDPAKQVTHEDVAAKALNVGKVLASRNAAVSQFGAEDVNTRLTEFNSIFEGNEMINNLVLNAEAPVYEAFRILDRYKFETKYGSTPAEWHKSIRAEAEKELSEKLRKEITDEVMGRIDKSKTTPRGLSSSRGSNGLGSGQNSKGKGPTPLGEVIGN